MQQKKIPAHESVLAEDQIRERINRLSHIVANKVCSY